MKYITRFLVSFKASFSIVHLKSPASQDCFAATTNGFKTDSTGDVKVMRRVANYKGSKQYDTNYARNFLVSAN